MGLIKYNVTRRIDRIMSSQGDGTGTITQIVTAKTVSGATDATPIVITATDHGYSDGDSLPPSILYCRQGFRLDR